MFDCSFQHFKKKVWQWVKEQIDGIIIDYDLVKINEHKSHPFYTILRLEDFLMTLNIEQGMEWNKAYNCNNIVYKLELIE